MVRFLHNIFLLFHLDVVLSFPETYFAPPDLVLYTFLLISENPDFDPADDQELMQVLDELGKFLLFLSVCVSLFYIYISVSLAMF